MILAIGEVLIDVFEDYQRIGGAPFNFAFHLKQLGWPVRLLTRIGNDAHGKNILAMVDSVGLDVQDIQVDARHPSGTVQVTLDTEKVPQFDIRGDVAYDYLDLVNVKPIDWPAVQMIYFGSLAQRTTNGFRNIQHFIAQRSPDTKVFCDINLRPPHVHAEAVMASLKLADVVKLNMEELAQIRAMHGGAAPPGEDEIAWLMRCFSVESVILTLGSQGSRIRTANQNVAAYPIVGGLIVDTVGAGDAYAAVAAAGFLKGLPLEAVAAMASEFAAYICSLPGAVPEDDAAYAKLRLKIKGPDHVE